MLQNITPRAVFAQPIALALSIFLSMNAFAQENTAFSRYQDQKRNANENTVTIMGSQAVTAYTRMAEDMQNVLDEPQSNGMRILPLLGRGGGQNFLDLLFLKGIDMGIVEQDVITYFRQRDPVLFANSEQRIQYVTKLTNSEFHLFVAPDIKTLADLKGKAVSFYKPVSSSAIAAETIFKICGIEVDGQFLDQDLAQEKFKKGELSAIARISGAPHSAFEKFKAAEGHFLPFEPSTLPNGCYEKLLEIYLPAFLKHEHYPQAIAEGEFVPTIAGSTILAIYAWPENTERYQKSARFVKKLFDNIDKLREGPRHPKWKEINLAAEVPGWQRFKPAQQWLNANRQAPATQSTAEMKTAFDSFLKEYAKASGSGDLTKVQKEALFGQFVKWWQTQKPQQAAR